MFGYILQNMLPNVHINYTCVPKKEQNFRQNSLSKKGVAIYLNSLNVYCIMGYSSNYFILDNMLLGKCTLEFEITSVNCSFVYSAYGTTIYPVAQVKNTK